MVIAMTVGFLALATAILVCAYTIDSLIEDVARLKRDWKTLDDYDTDMRDRVRLVEQRLDRLEGWANGDWRLDGDTN